MHAKEAGPAPAPLASAAVWVFGVVVVAYGLSGIVLPDLWLNTLLHVPPLPDSVRPTLLSELRFLEGREVGVGLFSLLFHDEILTSRKHNLVFLALVYLSPGARVYSCVTDGLPSLLLLTFLAIELGMAVLLTISTRHVRSRPR
jgi:hypothetical protein